MQEQLQSALTDVSYAMGQLLGINQVDGCIGTTSDYVQRALDALERAECVLCDESNRLWDEPMAADEAHPIEVVEQIAVVTPADY